MALSSPVVVPVSAIDIGTTGKLSALQLKYDDAFERSTELGDLVPGAVVADASMKLGFLNPTASLLFTPNLPGAQLAAELLNWVPSAPNLEYIADVNADIAGLIPKVTLLKELQATLSTALGVPGVYAWSWSGRVSSLDVLLGSMRGITDLPPDAVIGATIILTESPESWGFLSAGLNTGKSLSRAPTQAALEYLGKLGGAGISYSAKDTLRLLDILIGQSDATLFDLEAELKFASKLDVPDLELAFDISAEVVADVGVSALLDATFTLPDFDVDIAAHFAYLAKLSAEIGDLGLRLGGGGLAVWQYRGLPGDLGNELSAAVREGIPGGTGAAAGSYGLILACGEADWAKFGKVVGA